MRFDQPLPKGGPARTEPARVSSNLETGSIILAGPQGDVAIHWKKSDEHRSRGLPPGTYRLRTVRIEREQKGVHWFLSATSQPRKPMAFGSGAKVKLEVADTVHFKGKVKRMGRKLQLNFEIHSKTHQGLSVYKNGKRVPVTYKLLSAKGEVLATGKMNYG